MKRTRIVIGFVIFALVAVPAMAEGFGFAAAAQRGALALSQFVSAAMSLATPEPTSLILVGICGLILVGAARRRRAA